MTSFGRRRRPTPRWHRRLLETVLGLPVMITALAAGGTAALVAGNNRCLSVRGGGCVGIPAHQTWYGAVGWGVAGLLAAWWLVRRLRQMRSEGADFFPGTGVEVPMVLSLDPDVARAEMERAGLHCILEADVRGDGALAGRVTRQSPRSGTQVFAGDAVRIGVAGHRLPDGSPEAPRSSV